MTTLSIKSFSNLAEGESGHPVKSCEVLAEICLHIEADTVPLCEPPVDCAVSHVRVVLVVEQLLKQGSQSVEYSKFKHVSVNLSLVEASNFGEF